MRLNERKGSERIKHFGDITKLSGHELPIVDCIIGGSPCQDLSVAGKRAGLAGERSGLFMEQMRIVKEMRERTDYHDGLILFKRGRGIRLRCTRMCAEKDRVLFFNGKDLMVVALLSEIKAAIFADIDEESMKILCDEENE